MVVGRLLVVDRMVDRLVEVEVLVALAAEAADHIGFAEEVARTALAAKIATVRRDLIAAVEAAACTGLARLAFVRTAHQEQACLERLVRVRSDLMVQRSRSMEVADTARSLLG